MERPVPPVVIGNVTPEAASIQAAYFSCTDNGSRVEYFGKNFGSFVLFDDDDLLVINKPPGILSHSNPESKDTELGVEEMANYYYRNAALIHRLDRDTSGVLILGKTSEGKQGMRTQFATRRLGLSKIYSTILQGRFNGMLGKDHEFNLVLDIPTDSPTNTNVKVIEDPREYRNGKSSKTIIRPRFYVERPGCTEPFTFALVKLHTGRTHQIRVTAAYNGNPVAGDVMYGAAPGVAPRQLLHASQITFFHPITDELLSITAPMTADMDTWLAESKITVY
jgi:RluA family pseudouridine synthase